MCPKFALEQLKIMSDPNLTESGRINLGDIGELEKNPSQILDPNGKSVTSDRDLKGEAEELAKKAFRSDGVAWHLDEEASKLHGHDMFFPRLAIAGIAEKFGVSRPKQQFFPDERNMFMQAFMSDCGLYLFGVEPFVEVVTPECVVFEPNPAWAELPVLIMKDVTTNQEQTNAQGTKNEAVTQDGEE